jgi:GT2 family glycosyltransferase
LFHEDFRYRETGLLDSTHLRFFGLEGIRRLLASAGLAIESAETTRIDPAASEFSQAWISLPEWLVSGMKARPLGDVYQYVIKARPEGAYKEALKFDGLREGLPVSDQYENRIAEAERVAVQAQAEVERVAAQAQAEAEAARSKVAEMELLVERMKGSASWRVTRPFRFVARLCRHGLLDQDRLFLFHGIRNRYHRLPLPSFVKKTISFSYHQVLKRFLQRFSRSIDCSVPVAAPSVQPSPQGDTWDYIVWGVIDWHFRHQRPQQLALAIAEAGRRVFFVSSNLIDDDRPGFAAEAIGPGGRIFQVSLFAEGAPSIYSSAPSPETVEQIRQSIGEVLDWADSRHVVSLVDHPFWHDIARVVPNSRLVYDCMDHHEGFGNNGDALLRLEQQLIAEADVTITTSSWLENAVAPLARNVAILRNACDFQHFSKVPPVVHRDPHGRPVIGYYGAIAEWFDLDLVEAVAKSNPECSVMLIGADTVNAKSRLGKLSNVTFTGEVPYGLLPQYLHGFDVCLLPFKIIPLTLATNPVKAYEYLSAGKPVVAVDLPEMSQFAGLIRVAADRDEFVRAVREAMQTPESDEIAQKRRAFARSQTWGHRAESLREYSEDISNDPRVSVVVVTYNNIELTKECLASIDAYSHYGNLEVIVVDNASSDGTQGYLAEWVLGASERKIITNGQNKGFAAANNQGLALATGDYLVLLNNDTYVTPGWIRTLARHLERDRTIGLIGPVTNNIGNEAKIDIAYGGMDEMLTESAKYTRRHIGQLPPLRTAAFFCAMMPRAVYERVGDLDESFGRGFFEDDDYCRRIEHVGLRIACAEDVFVHHHLSASFNQLGQKEREALFNANRAIYEAKWGRWQAHGYR